MSEVEEENPNKADSESEDECEVLEESPCGRWQKRREEVRQRDVPGIDNAFLAMDTEEGVEVVWNEVQFSANRNLKDQQARNLARRRSSVLHIEMDDKIRQVFNSLIRLDHPNIVKFHQYWTDTKDGRPRVIFITEYMSSGSLKQFLKNIKKNNKTFQLKAWKRWCTQILSALSYLHSCNIIHGNLTCDTIFIQHNGLIKIGSVAPDAMHIVKTYRKDIKNMHYVAPEYAEPSRCTTAIDIYSFGMCALEIAALGFQGNGGEGGSHHVTTEAIKNTLVSLENPLQRDFIQKCIQEDPSKRPEARTLLFHAILFEVHSLQLLSAHTFVNSRSILPETDETSFKKIEPNTVIAEIVHPDGREPEQWKYCKCPALEREKFLEDVRNGIYPLTAFTMLPAPPKPRAKTPEVAPSEKGGEDLEPMDVEMRMVTQSTCQIKKMEDPPRYQITLQLKMDDKMNRQLTADISEEDSAALLAEELVHYGFINIKDRETIAQLIEDNIKTNMIINGSLSSEIVASA